MQVLLVSIFVLQIDISEKLDVLAEIIKLCEEKLHCFCTIIKIERDLLCCYADRKHSIAWRFNITSLLSLTMH